MINKNFDCVEMQRTIREGFWNEAQRNSDNLDKIIDRELENSELYKFFIERKKQADLSKSA